MTATPVPSSHAEAPAPRPRRGIARLHVGQLVILSVGILVAAPLAGVVVREHAKQFRATVPQEHGYSGVNDRVANEVHSIVAMWYATPVDERTDGIYSLVQRHLSSQGIEQDFSAAEAARARVERWNLASWALVASGFALLVSLWWRWFGARA